MARLRTYGEPFRVVRKLGIDRAGRQVQRLRVSLSQLKTTLRGPQRLIGNQQRYCGAGAHVLRNDLKLRVLIPPGGQRIGGQVG